MSEKKRVLLAFPVFNYVYAPAFDNFVKLLLSASRHCPDYVFDPFVIERQAVHGAMNMAVDAAKQIGSHALIMFDDDCLPAMWKYDVSNPLRYQVLPRLLALLDQRGHDIVAGVGYMRSYPHTTTVGRKYDEGISAVLDTVQKVENKPVVVLKGFHWIDDLAKHESECDTDGLLSVDFCGVPIMAVSKRVLDAVPTPLFATQDEMGGPCTHDIYFCQKAKRYGFSVKVDTQIDCGHIVSPPIVNRFTRQVARIGQADAERRTDNRCCSICGGVDGEHADGCHAAAVVSH